MFWTAVGSQAARQMLGQIKSAGFQSGAQDQEQAEAGEDASVDGWAGARPRIATGIVGLSREAQ